MDIGKRLKEERERLGLTQPQLGVLGGAGKTTVIAWERGTAYPNAAFLAAIAAAGVDVLYVVTGQRASAPALAPLKPDEAALLDNYRHAPEDQQRLLRETGAAFAKRQGKRRAS